MDAATFRHRSPTDDFTKEIAKVQSTFLGVEDHGIFTCYLRMDFGGGQRSVGGYFLDDYEENARVRVGTARGCEFVMRVLRACGVGSWEKVTGRTVFVLLGPDRRVKGIEPLPTEPGERFVFADVMGQPDERVG